MTNPFRFFKNIIIIWKNKAILQVIADLVAFIEQTAELDKPLYTKIAMVNAKSGKEFCDLVSLWASTGRDNPIDRIATLKSQNEELKRLLKLVIHNKATEEDKELILLTLKKFE